MAVPDPAARSPKAEQTRQTIVDAAMRLFRGSGYDRHHDARDRGRGRASRSATPTTTSAPRSTWSRRSTTSSRSSTPRRRPQVLEQRAAAFAARLEGVLLAWLDVAAPHHEFAGQFFKNAADPTQPAVAVQRGVGAGPRREHRALRHARSTGSDAKVAPALRARAARAALAAADGHRALLGLRPEPRPGPQPDAGTPGRADRRPAGAAVPDARRARDRRRRRRPDEGAAVVMTGRIARRGVRADRRGASRPSASPPSRRPRSCSRRLSPCRRACRRSSATTSSTACWRRCPARIRTAAAVDVVHVRAATASTSGPVRPSTLVSRSTTDVVGVRGPDRRRPCVERRPVRRWAQPQRKRFSFSPDSVGSLTAIPSATARSLQPSPSRAIRAITTPVSGTPRVSVIRASSAPLLVDDAAVGVGDPLERVALVAGDQQEDRVDLPVHLRQVDGDRLVVPVAAAGGVVAEVLDRAVAGRRGCCRTRGRRAGRRRTAPRRRPGRPRAPRC